MTSYSRNDLLGPIPSTIHFLSTIISTIQNSFINSFPAITKIEESIIDVIADCFLVIGIIFHLFLERETLDRFVLIKIASLNLDHSICAMLGNVTKENYEVRHCYFQT